MKAKPKAGLGAKLTALIAVITLVTISLVGISLSILSAQKDDATVINIAGRQRMLSQKMSKEAMAIQAGISITQNQASLKETYDLFDSSLKALIKGDKQLQLPPTTNAKILAQMRKVESVWQEFSPSMLSFIQGNNSNRSPEKILTANITLLEEMNIAVGLYEQASRTKVSTLRTLLIGGGIIALLVTVLCWLVINRKVIRPLHKVLRMINKMEEGDLSLRLEMSRNDEIGQLADAMDEFADNLKNEILTAFNRLAEGDFTFSAEGLIKSPLAKANQGLITSMLHVQDASTQISTGAVQVANSSSSLADGATQQAAALEQISASMTEMQEQTSNNAANAATANQLVGEVKSFAEKGNNQMQSMVSAMNEIKGAGQSISKIIKVIDEIAFQTNLLALNAAVEAARAGQHGKGFAVVAEEVRNLAARSAKAAQETTALIEGSVEKTNNGGKIADQTAKALSEIVEGVTKVSDLVAEIAAASHEQSLGIEQVNEGLHQLDDVNQKATSTAEGSAAIAEELSTQTEDLQQMLRGFKLGQKPMAMAMPAPVPLVLHQSEGTGSGGWGDLSAPKKQPQQNSQFSIEWNDSLNTGITAMDNQHLKLVDLINQLLLCMKDGGDRMLLGSVVDELVKYTVIHFRTEEELMKKHRYPDLDNHKKIHATFVSEVTTFAEKLKSGARLAPADIYRFLKDWLISHIEKQDRDGYAPYVLNRR